MLNKVILMGRLTRDPEIRQTPSGVTVANFSLAVDRKFARQGEERQTDFINIVTFSKTAEFVSKYFSKGQLVAVAGRIQTRSWEDQNGGKQYRTEVVAEECHFAEPKREQAGGAQPQYGAQQAPQTPYGAQQSGGQSVQGQPPYGGQAAFPGYDFDYDDQDLPF